MRKQSIRKSNQALKRDIKIYSSINNHIRIKYGNLNKKSNTNFKSNRKSNRERIENEIISMYRTEENVDIIDYYRRASTVLPLAIQNFTNFVINNNIYKTQPNLFPVFVNILIVSFLAMLLRHKVCGRACVEPSERCGHMLVQRMVVGQLGRCVVASTFEHTRKPHVICGLEIISQWEWVLCAQSVYLILVDSIWFKSCAVTGVDETRLFK